MDNATRREIEKVTWNTLRDAGISEPPVGVEVLLEHLELHRGFYDLQKPGFLDRAKYKMRISGKKITDIIKRIKLLAVLFYDENRIVVDSSLPLIKQDWPSFHESSHKILQWHRPYFYGDTAQTLHPDWQEKLEAEANYSASALMFCGPVFSKEALDTKPNWSNLAAIKERYGKSFVTTGRRYVEHGPDCPMVFLISTAHWKEKPLDQLERWRHFNCSPEFKGRFGNVTPADLLGLVDSNTSCRRGGPVGNFTCSLRDNNGTSHEFLAESFFNGHYVMTLIVHFHECSTSRIILPSSSFKVP